MFENNSGELGIFFDCVDLTWNPDFVLLAVCFFKMVSLEQVIVNVASIPCRDKQLNLFLCH